MTPHTLCLVSGLLVLSACQAQPQDAAPGSPAALKPPVAPPAAQTVGARPVGFPQYPSISPDGKTIVFSYAGDLWAVATTGGVAQRLTSHPSDELRSAFSPDGTRLAFESERDGPRNIYIMPVAREGGGLAVGPITRVTTADRAQTLSGFSTDGSSVLFSASEPSIFRGTRMFKTAADGTGVTERLTLAYGGAPHAEPGADSFLFTRGRYDQARPAYTGSASTDIYRCVGGQFTRLTEHAAHDADAFPITRAFAYVSARDGQNNIWRLEGKAKDGAARQLTHFRTPEGKATIGHGVRDFNVAAGGSTGVFAVWDTIYTIDLAAEKPDPKPVYVGIGGDFASLDFDRMNLAKEVSEAALSPDGKTLAVVARGEVFVRSTEKDRPTRRLTDTPARERDLAWSPDGKTLHFASDSTGVYGIYSATVDLSREDLKPKKEEPAKEDKKADAKEGAKAEPSDPAKPADHPEPPKDEKQEEIKGEAPKEKKPDIGKRWAEALTFKIEPRWVGNVGQRSPVPSPDGTKLLLTRGRGDLVMIDLAGGAERVLFPGWNEPEAVWAGDSRHIIYSVSDLNFNADLWLLDTGDAAAAPVNLTRHPDNDESPRLSADGKVLVFLSDRDADANGDSSIYGIYLDRALESKRPYELADYFKEAAEAAKKRKPLGADDKPVGKTTAKDGEPAKDAQPDSEKPADKPEPKAKTSEPLRFDAADAYLRIRRVTTVPGGAGSLQLTPGGERVLFTASDGGAPGLFSVDYKGSEKKTVQAGRVSGVRVNLPGDKAFFVSAGEAASAQVGGGSPEKYPVDAPVTIDIEQQQKQKFLEAARELGDNFYHPTLKGLDWAALTARYLELAMSTRTDPEFNRVVASLFGELDGSHLGISGGRRTGGEGEPFGYLGVDVSPAPEGWKVDRVIAHSPADGASSRLNPGDIITSVEGSPTSVDGTPAQDLARALAGTVGRETLISVRRAGAAADTPLIITPVSSAADTGLRYDDEVQRRARLVSELSGGRLGYLHIRGMDIGSVRDFERDLYAAANGKDGLIIDVRDNGGGWTCDILLASLTAPRHAYTIPRGADPKTVPPDAYPRDRRLIYGYDRPITVLINQNSYSNAEIFPHAIKTIGRGKLVGTETFGAVISTGGTGLIDGTTVRLPFRGWYLPDGTDMEKNGAKPDIDVPMSPEDEAAGRDPQIEAAVKELLERSAKEPIWTWWK